MASPCRGGGCVTLTAWGFERDRGNESLRGKEDKMPRDWILEVQQGLDAVCTMRLRLQGESLVEGDVVATCRSLDEFRDEIARMKAELDGVLETARQKMETLQKEGAGSRAGDPAKIWQEMELTLTEKDMFALFNGYSSSDRQIIAEYILTHVNMFKGRGPLFSEHYDSATHLLE
jgi:hypothetical protein